MLKCGTLVNARYALGRRIGHGAYGAVYHATCLGTSARLAVKIEPPRTAASPKPRLASRVDRL